jgi:hypothetical protein
MIVHVKLKSTTSHRKKRVNPAHRAGHCTVAVITDAVRELLDGATAAELNAVLSDPELIGPKVLSYRSGAQHRRYVQRKRVETAMKLGLPTA